MEFVWGLGVVLCDCGVGCGRLKGFSGRRDGVPARDWW